MASGRRSELKEKDNYMNTYSKDSKLLLWLIALALTGFLFGCGGGSSGGSSGNSGSGSSSSGSSSNAGPAGASPSLGSAAAYGILAHAGAITIQVDGRVTGDVALDPVAACNGCGPGHDATVSGTINNGDVGGLAHQAFLDQQAAYNNALARKTDPAYAPCTVAGDLEQLQPPSAPCASLIVAGPGPTNTFKPGLYVSGVAIGIGVTKTITLDAGGNADAVFIFQTDSALTTGTNSVVVLANGAQAKNVWWIAGSAATLGVSSTFKGSVLANSAAVTVLNGTAIAPTLVEGRLFSSGAAAEVDSFATVTVPM
jgi:Ice-binding-like